jgi:hypothetical protein
MSFGRTFEWKEHLSLAVEVLSRSESTEQAAEELTTLLDHPITRKGLLSAMARAYRNGVVDQPLHKILGSRRGITNADVVVASSNTATTKAEGFGTSSAVTTVEAPTQTNDPELLKVVRAVQKGITNWQDLADHLDLSPKRTNTLVQETIKAGYDIRINAAGELVFELPPITVTSVPDVPIDGKGWSIIGVMSDMHVGSKHCMKDNMVRFIERAYAEGVRQMIIPGDLCEGNLQHHGFQFEVEFPDYDSQVDLLLQLLPEKPDLKYYFCVGNHEVNSWFKTIGMRPDRSIQERAIARGRNDMIAVGALTQAQESAYILLNPGDPETEIKVELSHTSDKKAYAISYPLQKHVEALQPGAKPHVLLKGHLHSHSFFDLRGVVCLQTACFKGQGTWERQKNMQPQVGGTVLWLQHNGEYFDAKHYWMAVRPAPMIWEPVG